MVDLNCDTLAEHCMYTRDKVVHKMHTFIVTNNFNVVLFNFILPQIVIYTNLTLFVHININHY